MRIGGVFNSCLGLVMKVKKQTTMMWTVWHSLSTIMDNCT
jgi:hypothetical protein